MLQWFITEESGDDAHYFLLILSFHKCSFDQLLMSTQSSTVQCLTVEVSKCWKATIVAPHQCPWQNGSLLMLPCPPNPLLLFRLVVQVCLDLCCHLYLQHVAELWHSDSVVATWWECHAWEICRHSLTVSLESVFVCLCMCVRPFPPNTTGDCHALWVIYLVTVLLLWWGPNHHYSSITAIWGQGSEAEVWNLKAWWLNC